MPLYAKPTTAFMQFLKENSFTATQAREAYMQFVCGSENTPPDASVLHIVEKMQEMSDEGFPLNRFLQIIQSRQDDDALSTYHTYVDSLKISDKEKRIFDSIVTKNRKGEIDCFVDGKLLVSFKVDDADIPANARAMKLMRALEKIFKEIPKGKRYEFNFSED